MTTIARIIAFPITLIIHIVCICVILLFNWDLVKETKDKNTGWRVAFLRIQIEARNLYLAEVWERNPIFCAFLSLVVYYSIFIS